ncbi:hypothetical protein D3C71_1166300 [compost metagenome]
MQFTDFIKEENAAMRLGHRSRLRLRYSCDSHRTGSLVDRIMNRTDQRIGDAPLVKTGGRRVDFRKLRIRLEGREGIPLGLLHHNAGGRRLADTRRTVNDNMLGVGAAQRRL